MARSSCLRHRAVPKQRDVDHSPGVADVDLVERLVLHGTDRVVAREVECAELLDGDGHTSLDVGFHRDVSGDRDPAPTRSLEQLDGFVGGRGIDIVHRDTRAGRRQGERDRRVRAHVRRR